MPYMVKEMFYSIQGEGVHVGTPAVFCRFAGCNLWSGIERDRATAVCRFCDTQFVGIDGMGGGRFEDADQLALAIVKTWPHTDEGSIRWVICTGGEPALQLDNRAVQSLKAHCFDIAIETNGTRPLPRGLDWVCVSPKANADLVVKSGNELKLVYPQEGIDPSSFEKFDFDYFYLQPMDGPLIRENTRRAVRYCLDNPCWKLSLQTHKLLGLR